MSYKSFEDLDVWKRGCRLSVDIYRLLADCRDFGLRDQMQRSAVSIPSNIAEGCERGGKDFARFLKIALGSDAELRTQIYIAREIELLPKETTPDLLTEVKRISKMLSSLRRSVIANTDPKK